MAAFRYTATAACVGAPALTYDESLNFPRDIDDFSRVAASRPATPTPHFYRPAAIAGAAVRYCCCLLFAHGIFTPRMRGDGRPEIGAAR